MVNHFYDGADHRTRCGDLEGMDAYYCSSKDLVSCSDCLDLMTPLELVRQHYATPHRPAERGDQPREGA